MSDNQLSKRQLTAIIEGIAREVIKVVNSDIPQKTDLVSMIENYSEHRAPRGRPKSQYTGQLHLKVLYDDEQWFKSMARNGEMQNGKLFNLMRRHFEIENENSSF